MEAKRFPWVTCGYEFKDGRFTWFRGDTDTYWKGRAPGTGYKLNRIWEDFAITGGKVKDKVYIIGPMRGIKDFNFPAFYMAGAMMELWGYETVNPARIDIDCGTAKFDWRAEAVIMDEGFSYPDAMRKDFKAILDECKAVVLLPGWEKSFHGRQELMVAVTTGVKVFEYTDAHTPIDIEHDVPLAVKVDADCRPVRRES